MEVERMKLYGNSPILRQLIWLHEYKSFEIAELKFNGSQTGNSNQENKVQKRF
jgi:hypothetical protein